MHNTRTGFCVSDSMNNIMMSSVACILCYHCVIWYYSLAYMFVYVLCAGSTLSSSCDWRQAVVACTTMPAVAVYALIAKYELAIFNYTITLTTVYKHGVTRLPLRNTLSVPHVYKNTTSLDVCCYVLTNLLFSCHLIQERSGHSSI